MSLHMSLDLRASFVWIYQYTLIDFFPVYLFFIFERRNPTWASVFIFNFEQASAYWDWEKNSQKP